MKYLILLLLAPAVFAGMSNKQRNFLNSHNVGKAQDSKGYKATHTLQLDGSTKIYHIRSVKTGMGYFIYDILIGTTVKRKAVERGDIKSLTIILSNNNNEQRLRRATGDGKRAKRSE